MSESVLKSILEESARLEWAKYENAPEHVFSKKQERKMKHSFKLFEKKSGRFVTHECAKSSHIRLTKKTVLVLLTILFLAVLAGGALFSFTSSNFRGRIYSDNTEIYAITTENCPATIEEKYYLPCLPDGYEVLQTDSTPFFEYISYYNVETEQSFLFCQHVKKDGDPFHLNTEGYYLEEIKVNNCCGLFIDFSSDDYIGSELLWDNGDYILELSGDIDKNFALFLAENAKVLES